MRSPRLARGFCGQNRAEVGGPGPASTGHSEVQQAPKNKEHPGQRDAHRVKYHAARPGEKADGKKGKMTHIHRVAAGYARILVHKNQSTQVPKNWRYGGPDCTPGQVPSFWHGTRTQQPPRSAPGV